MLGRTRVRWFVGAAALAVAASALAVLATLAALWVRPLVTRSAAGPDATLGEVVADPAVYEGETVVVAGEVSRVYGPRAFVLRGSEDVFGPELLVVADRAITPIDGRTADAPVLPGDIVAVHGVVRSFDPGDVQWRTGADLDEAALWPWRQRPSLVADFVSINPRLSMSAATALVGEIAANPTDYLGRRVSVLSQVARIVGPRSFVVGGDDFVGRGELLVLTARPIDAPPDRPPDLATMPDDLVRVTGRVRALDVAALEAEVGIDLDEHQLAPWIGRPVLVATEVDLTPRARSRVRSTTSAMRSPSSLAWSASASASTAWSRPARSPSATARRRTGRSRSRRVAR
jgi:hypothetical protein